MAISLTVPIRPKKVRVKLGAKPKNEPEPEYLKTSEAAAFLRISEPTLRKLVKEGVVPFARVGRRMLFSKRKLKAYLDGETS